MEILAPPNEWTFVDAEKLAAFLNSETGHRLIQKLADGCPPLLEAGDTNAILIRSGMVRAYGLALEVMSQLAHPSAPTAGLSKSDYPAPEDDALWQDGQKLNDPNPPEFQVPPPETIPL